MGGEGVGPAAPQGAGEGGRFRVRKSGIARAGTGPGRGAYGATRFLGTFCRAQKVPTSQYRRPPTGISRSTPNNTVFPSASGKPNVKTSD